MKRSGITELFVALYAREGRRGRGLQPQKSRFARLPRTILILLIAGAMLGVGLWWSSAVRSLMSGHDVSALRSLTVLLTPARNSVAIGRKDLGQPPGEMSAEERHIDLTLDKKTGAVTLRNSAQKKRLWLSYRGEDKYLSVFGLRFMRLDVPFETFAERIRIPPGNVWRLSFAGGSAIFRNVTSTAFDLDVAAAFGRPARSFHYDAAHGSSGLEFVKGGSWEDECVDPTYWTKTRRTLINLYQSAVRSSEERDIAVLGGQHDCLEDGRAQIGGVGELHWRELKIVRRGSLFMIAPFVSTERYLRPVALEAVDPVRLTPLVEADRRGFSEVNWQIDAKGPWGELLSMTAGRTQYEVTICRRADFGLKPDCADSGALPPDAARVVFKPTRKVPVFDLARCQQKESRQTCPSPLDTGDALDACSGDGAKCWRWSLPRNVLSQEVVFSSMLQRGMLSRWERVLRLGVVAFAVVLSIALSGGRRLLIRRRGMRDGYSLLPVLATLLSAALAVAPELANFAGFSPNAKWVMIFMFGNWGLAGLVLLVSAAGVSLGLFWLVVMVLAAIGSAALAAMAIDGDTTVWAQHFVRQKYLFFDLVPTVIIAVTSGSARRLRPFLEGMVVGVRPRYRILLWLPSLALVGAFGLWLVGGTQTGFGSFQPVEAGKFAALMLVATALLRLDPDVRKTAVLRDAPSRVVSIIAVIGFLLVLLSVPYLRSDWSPALIMITLLCGLLLVFWLPMCWRVVRGSLLRRAARFRVPLAFRPKVRWRWFSEANFAFLILVAVVVVLPLSLLFAREAAAWAVLNLHEWSDNIDDRLHDLEIDSLGTGRRVVAERFIAWSDLDFDNPPRPDCRDKSDRPQPPKVGEAVTATARACYRDIEWQVIQARRAIAQAPCDIASPLDASNIPLLHRLLAPLLATFRDVFLWARSSCGDAAGLQNLPPSTRVQPIRIPVVESDFAAAYLIGRFGLGAAALLYGAQAFLLGIIGYAFVRLGTARRGSRMDTGLRRFIAMMVAGSGLLFFLQWVLSWSNILGLLPVMGQPMSMLSYAISHHLFMVLPCLVVLVVSLRFASDEQPVLIPRGIPPRVRRGSLW